MHFFQHVAARRRYLDRVLTPAFSFAALEESCAPSYTHQNLPAAWIAWRRLFRAAAYFREFHPGPCVLDFGAGTGELFHLLSPPISYCYAEEADHLADYIAAEIPGSKRMDPDALPPRAFDAIFALDSLEHNDEPAPILEALARALKPDGLFVLSGPTESGFYRLGRKIAGFSGHYHESDIFAVEALAAKNFRRIATARLPFAMPLFRISCWRPR